MADIQAYFNFQTREPAKAVFKIAPVVTDYPVLTNKPQINSVELVGNKTLTDLGITAELDLKQDKLTAGQNITIEDNVISATSTVSTSWGNITGTLSNQTDLQTTLNTKQDTLTAGSNIQITNNTISATNTTYTAGTGIDITNNVISNTQTSAEWGNITGTLSNQTDLNTALSNKQPVGDYATNIALTDGLATKENVISDLATIRSNATAGKAASNTISTYGDIVTHNTSEFATSAQGTLADTAIQPNDNISELINDSGYITNSALNGYATETYVNNYHDSTKQDVLTAGSNIQITDNTISATDTIYTSGTNISIGSNNSINFIGSIPTKTSELTNDSDYITASYHDSSKQDVLTAGSNIQISNNTISATDTTYTAGNGLTLTGTEFTANVINNVTSTSTTNALSANMGKELQDEISNLKARGRFLSEWNSTTGLPETNPTTLPYAYETGSYFIVGTVGSINYKPTGSQYTGVASTTVETENVAVNDTYLYDGSTWKLLHGADVTVTFASIAGQPTDNSNLATALNAKQDTLTAGTDINITNNTVSFNNNTGYITSSYHDSTKQDVLTAGNNIQISNNTISATDTTYVAGTNIGITNNTINFTGTIPTVNNNTITIKQGTTTKGTFTLNQNSDATITLDEGSSGADVDLSNLSTTGKAVAAEMSMPSATYVDLTLGASGTVYTAPANGYYQLVKSTGGTGGVYMYISNGDLGTTSDSQCFFGQWYVGMNMNVCWWIPVRKGQQICPRYTFSGQTESFKFFYAEGEI